MTHSSSNRPLEENPSGRDPSRRDSSSRDPSGEDSSNNDTSSSEGPNEESLSGHLKEIREVLREGDARALLRFFGEVEDFSESTARTYRTSWTDFHSWCVAEDWEALPARPQALAQFLRDRSDLSMGTLRNRVSTIGTAHRLARFESPTKTDAVKRVLQELSKQEATEDSERSPGEKLQAGPYSPTDILKGGPSLLEEYLEDVLGNGDTPGTGSEAAEDQSRAGSRSGASNRKRACEMWRDPVIEKTKASARRLTTEQKSLIADPAFGLPAMRDRAALLLMAEGKCSRAELARLDLIDVYVEETDTEVSGEEELERHLSDEPLPKEVRVGVRQKNGMPDRVLRLGEEEDLRLCPARAVTAWIIGGGLEGGALFRPFGSHGSLKERRIGTSSINLMVEKAAGNAGLDSSNWTPSRLSED